MFLEGKMTLTSIRNFEDETEISEDGRKVRKKAFKMLEIIEKL